MQPERLSSPPSSPLRIVLGYVLFGALWIIFSDLLLVQLVPEPLLATFSIAKGWVFIALTALLLHHFIGRQLARMAQLTAVARENEERLRTLEDNLPDRYVYRYLHAAGGTPQFLYLSAGVERLHGVRRQDVLRDASTLMGQIDPEQLPLLARAEEVSRQHLTDFQLELRLCRADGEWRWLQLCCRPLHKTDGQILWDGVATDITARRQMEESLQESTRRMTVILDGINALIYVADLATYEILFVNKYGRDLWGEVTGQACWKTLQDGQKGPCGFCSNDRLLTSAGVPTGVYAWEFQNTVTGKWYDCRDQVIRWSDGRLVRMEIATDITERKKAEEALRLQGAALQAAANAIAITDRNGDIEWVNPAFAVLTGYSEEEAIGRNPRELVKSGVHIQAFFKGLWDTLLAGEVWRGEMMNRHKDGTLYPEGQTITPVKDARGEITHFIAIKRDLTEHYKLEAQLQHAQKMESIGTLAGGIAHDFNNILTAIIGYGTLALMKMAPDDPQRPNIQHMLEAADRAAHLTRDLLIFSRKQVVDRKPEDLNEVVAKVEAFLKRVIGEDIACKTVLHTVPIPVLVDGYQLEQVLLNLATNARDAMPHGGALTVTTETVLLNEDFVSAHGFGKPGPYALITVTDTGSGMAEATRLRIFEPFFTTKEVGKGTGLGLAVTYGIIKQHDGYINVYSEPGSGTTFRIYLPVITAKEGKECQGRLDEISVGGTETILLAEDDKSVRDLTENVLTEFGYTVITAVDGADAVQKFTGNSERIDLLLLDLIMPKMNGKEALDEIRKVRPGIKVIFSSGYAPETIQQKASLADGAHLIAKPATPGCLLRKVRSVLDETGAS